MTFKCDVLHWVVFNLLEIVLVTCRLDAFYMFTILYLMHFCFRLGDSCLVDSQGFQTVCFKSLRAIGVQLCYTNGFFKTVGISSIEFCASPKEV